MSDETKPADQASPSATLLGRRLRIARRWACYFFGGMVLVVTLCIVTIAIASILSKLIGQWWIMGPLTLGACVALIFAIANEDEDEHDKSA